MLALAPPDRSQDPHARGVGTGGVEPRSNRVARCVFGRADDHAAAGAILPVGHRASSRHAGGQVEREHRLSKPWIAIEDDELAEWQVARPQPAHRLGLHVLQANEDGLEHFCTLWSLIASCPTCYAIELRLW